MSKKVPANVRRKLAWQAKFLEALSTNPNVTSACRVAGTTKANAYECRKLDEDFAAAWEEAHDQGIAVLEDAMHERATIGVREPLMYQGECVGHVHRPSDTLAIFLAKAHRPDKYRDTHKVEHSGSIEHRQVIVFELPDNGRDERDDVVEGRLVVDQPLISDASAKGDDE